jgi:hypothetical protein
LTVVFWVSFVILVWSDNSPCHTDITMYKLSMWYCICLGNKNNNRRSKQNEDYCCQNRKEVQTWLLVMDTMEKKPWNIDYVQKVLVPFFTCSGP